MGMGAKVCKKAGGGEFSMFKLNAENQNNTNSYVTDKSCSVLPLLTLLVCCALFSLFSEQGLSSSVFGMCIPHFGHCCKRNT